MQLKNLFMTLYKVLETTRRILARVSIAEFKNLFGALASDLTSQEDEQVGSYEQTCPPNTVSYTL
jgi:hypothetical protein